jgi:hypothetical protein
VNASEKRNLRKQNSVSEEKNPTKYYSVTETVSYTSGSKPTTKKGTLISGSFEVANHNLTNSKLYSPSPQLTYQSKYESKKNYYLQTQDISMNDS